ncbi:cytochrome P450 [Streptomyces sp. NPDC101158]|uniref:cytochrome P450 n=1 Tax=Streptomyces sp. NPDC101158 TaxID=3366117 RepID=UPI00380CCDFB
MPPFETLMGPLRDGTIGVWAHGYAWLPDRLRTTDGTTYRTRLLGKPVTALHGPEAVRFFYDERNVVRKEALPGPVLDTLFGRGAVHTLDGEAHRARKALFLALLKDEKGLADLGAEVRRRWREAVEGRTGERVVLFDESAKALALAVCHWAGLPLSGPEAQRLAHDCTAMVDGFAAPGPRHVRARHARARQEKAMADLIEALRETPRPSARDEVTALEAVARHQGTDGSLLDPHTAAVELLNIVRPTIAIAWFATFAAHALHRWPHHRDLLRSDGGGVHARAFAHEVRRFYPFAPFVGGLAARDLMWRGERIPEHTMVLLDLYGQNHDPALWKNPYRFDPHRFTGAGRFPEHLIPQGGGDPGRGHRCPGEDITVMVLATLATELARLDYGVPDQDLTIPLSRIPTLPRSGFELDLA